MCLGNGYEKPQFGALEFSRNRGLAEALQAEAVMYKLSLGWEVKTTIPVLSACGCTPTTERPAR